jgi:hypothetical protein
MRRQHGWHLIWFYDAHGGIVPLSQEWTDSEVFSDAAAELVDSIESNGGVVGSRMLYGVSSASAAWELIERSYDRRTP